MLNFLAGPFGAICKLVPLYSLLRSLFLTAGDIHEVVLIIEVVLRKDNFVSGIQDSCFLPGLLDGHVGHYF
jgi:hypothetical protein